MNKILRNASVLLGGNLASNLFSVLSIFLIARSLTAEVFGYLVLAMGYVEVMAKLFGFQTWQAFIRYASLKEEQVSVESLIKFGFMIDTASLLVAAAVAFFVLPIALNIFGVPVDFKPVFYILVGTIPLRFVESAVGVFRFFEAYRGQSLIAALVSLTKLGAVISLFFSTAASIVNYAWAIFLSHVVSVLLFLWLLSATLRANGTGILLVLKTSSESARLRKSGYLRFVFFNNFDVSIRMVSRYLDIFLLGRFYGSEAVAALKVAKEISSIVAKLLEPIYQALYPELARLLNTGAQSKAIETSKKISIYVFWASAIFYMSFLFIGSPLISKIIGESYSSAYTMTCMYLLATLLAASTMPIYPLQHALGLAEQAFHNQAISTALYVPLCIISVMYSAYGAAFSYVSYYLVLTTITIVSLRRAMPDVKLFH